jgi:pimeloyl-ACP methyl ester carboxylesterase
MEPRLVFVHGAGGTAASWDLQRLAFPSSVAVDLPGHRGEGRGRDRVEDYAAWLHATAHEHGWPPMVLVGHSMGGAIALLYALAHPEDLTGIALISTGARLRVLPAILDGLVADHAGTVDLIITACLAPAADPRLVRRLTDAMLAVPAEVTLGDYRACDAFDVMARLEQIRIPALVIGGRDDRMTPPKFADYLHAHLRGSRLVQVEGAGHMVHTERPRRVNEAIRQFLLDLGR